MYRKVWSFQTIQHEEKRISCSLAKRHLLELTKFVQSSVGARMCVDYVSLVCQF